MLAAGEFQFDEGTVKLLGAAVVGILWVASQVIGKVTKKSPSPSPQSPPTLPQRRVETPVDWPRTPPPRGPTVLRTPVVLRRPPPKNPPMRNSAPPARQNQVPARPQLPVSRPPATRPPVIRPPQIREPEYARQSLKPRDDEPSAVITQRRVAVASTLLKPDNLKAAFILTEILRPPVSLRDPEADSLSR